MSIWSMATTPRTAATGGPTRPRRETGVGARRPMPWRTSATAVTEAATPSGPRAASPLSVKRATPPAPASAASSTGGAVHARRTSSENPATSGGWTAPGDKPIG
ncbi:hypothetical protein AC230_16540 [Streptomyces caatingaensis]|uniref:Uncharacterized protein n=1 Tax=Streptomyces caatingaensis TaxID=1678637 RepID=A0A0K9XET5_9ACTN|nr:hypothetical protein AC230_16540 [Streptomyces caatingaensis]